MATRRRTTRRPPSRRRSSGSSLPAIALPTVPPDVARSIVGICFLVLGAVTLIALALPGQGALTDWWRDSIAPWFETGRWLVPFLLLAAGWYLEWGPGKRPGSGWGATIAGIALGFVGFLGAFEVLNVNVFGTERGGGRIGRFLASVLEPLLTGPGAFVICLAILAIGLMLAFNLQLRELVRPLTGSARWLGLTAAASLRREPGQETSTKPARAARNEERAVPAGPAPEAGRPVAASRLEPVGPGIAAASILDEPAIGGGPPPMSQTVWTGVG
ncbi:MAG TPA: DNA translocase FtsK 4TM domain-containing protein, partial [Candidatus Limnocylindrales bacterium]|nr:DNA translocase FtsK 4TM domain-containing protein [Candidatus Limnocylindrales bacterium]